MTMRHKMIPLRAKRAAARLLGRFSREQSGVAAVEFALIAPILVILYIGLYQISFIIQQDRNVSHATSVLGDLSTRITFLEEADLEDVFQAAIEILAVTNPTTLENDVEIDLSSFSKDSSNQVTRIGYARTPGATFPDVDTSSFNDRMLSDDIGTVVARIRYRYTMTSRARASDMNSVDNTKYLGENGIMLAEQFVLRPRESSVIPFGNPGIIPLPPSDYVCSINNDRTVSCAAG